MYLKPKTGVRVTTSRSTELHTAWNAIVHGMFTSAHLGAVGAVAASRHGVISRTQAAAMGVSSKQVARLIGQGVLIEELPGVLVIAGAPRTWLQRVAIATTAGRANSVAGFSTGAALQRLDGFPQVRQLELITPFQNRILRCVAKLHVAELIDRDVITIEGIRCTTVARTLVDIACAGRTQQVEQAFECAWRTGTSLAQIRHTAERLHRPGQRGTGVVLQLVEDAATPMRPTEPALESKLFAHLRGVPGLVRQQKVFDVFGTFVARVDFAVPRVQLAIEAHSRQFHFGIGATSRDEAREEALTALNWEVMYIGAKHLAAPGEIKARVAAAIRRREELFGAKLCL